MLLSVIVRTVDFCIRHVWGVIVLALFLAATSGAYAVHHFAIDTNVNNLISRDLPWRQRELDYQAAFPQSTQLILVVVDAPTPEEASAATRALASNLSTTPNIFRSVQEEGGGSFFNQNRFLFLPTEQVERSTRALASAAPIIRVLVKDPSLRGLVQALSYGLEGVKVGQITLDELAKPFAAASETLESDAAAQPVSFSWDALLQGNAQPSGKRRLIAVVPVLTAGKLEPGLEATVAHPPGELKPVGQPALAPVDHFLERRRILVISLTVILLASGIPALLHLQFDFNPLHLQRENSEAISTLRQLSKDPALGLNSAQILARSHDDATAIVNKLAALPEVAEMRTIWSLIPADQDKKLALIRNAARALGSALNVAPGVSVNDAENVEALRRGAQSLTTAAGTADGQGAKAAKRLAQDLTQLADATPEERASATQRFISPLKMDLADLREALKAQKVERASLPEDLVRDWVSQDGQERVDALPKGNLNNDKTMQRFVTAVLAAEPRATGQPIENLEWAKTMIHALIEAAAGASAAIAILLWIALRLHCAALEMCYLLSFRLWRPLWRPSKYAR